MSEWVIEDLRSSASPADFVSRFAAFPDAVRAAPYRAGLLSASHLRALVELPWSAAKNFFIASCDGMIVATIGASLSARESGLGMIGFYECDLTHPQASVAAGSLIAAAEAFLQQHGATRALAPVDYSTWFPYRFMRAQNSPPFYAWEPVQPPEFVTHFRNAGYEESTEYLSIGHDDATPFINAYTPALEKAYAMGYRLRSFDNEHFLDRDLPILHAITMAGFDGSYLFEPIPLAAFRELYVPIAGKKDLRHGFFLLDPSGKEVGYLFAFFDGPNQDHFVIKTMTLLPEARGLGLSNALVCNAFRLGRDHGSKRTIHAMMRSDAQSRSYGKHVTIDWEHHYLLMEKSF